MSNRVHDWDARTVVGAEQLHARLRLAEMSSATELSASTIDSYPDFTLPVPKVRPGGIEWSGGDGERSLKLAVTFDNPGDKPTRPTLAGVRVAAFGAFLPWAPFRDLAVPTIAPGTSGVVTTTVEARPLRNLLRRAAYQTGFNRHLDVSQGLTPTDLEQVIKRQQRLYAAMRIGNFVGNFDVLPEGQPGIERHCGSFCVRAGTNNLAMVGIGRGTAERYSASVGACEPGWGVGVDGHDFQGGSYEIERPGRHMVVISPPARAESGAVALTVRRESTQQETDIEFQLDVTRPDRSSFFP